jgi:hypothetical protein
VLAGAALSSSALLIALGLGLEACGSDSTESGGRRISLATRIALNPTDGASFSTGRGWKVTLTRAFVATGALYYFDSKPALVLQERNRAWEYARGFLSISTAHAHPGHYSPGNALGQMLEPYSVDLLAGTTELASSEAVTGTFRSGTFGFATVAAGPVAAELGASVALAEGRAEKDGEEPRYFRAAAGFDDIAKSASGGQVQGCKFVASAIERSGTVTVHVSPRVWFNLVDFRELLPGSPEARSEFVPDSQPRIAFAQGLAEVSAYEFSYASE